MKTLNRGTVLISDLDLDQRLYVRRGGVDPYHVSKLAKLLKNGEKLPPVVYDEKSKRLVDGFHRVAAWERVNGLDCPIPARSVRYASDSAILEAGHVLNKHGKPLTSADLAHCAIVGRSIGMTDEETMAMLRMDAEDFMDLLMRKTATTGRGEKKHPIAITRAIENMAGKNLNQAQAEASRHLGGASQIFYADQLIKLLETGMIDELDKKLAARLGTLRDRLVSADLP